MNRWILMGVCLLGIAIGAAGASFFLRYSPALTLAAFETETDFGGEAYHEEVPATSTNQMLEEETHQHLEREHTVDTVPRGAVTVSTPSVDASSSPRSVRVPVMIYHSVRPRYPGESAYQDSYDVTPELLTEEIVYLKTHGYTTVKFADVIAYFDYGTPLPEKPVILSFDDGWANQYRYAYPVLRREGVVGTFFVYTNPIGRNPLWMTWSQIEEMDKAGMEIAGHSRTHPVLTHIDDYAGLVKEILGGKEALETHLGHPIDAFAYPFGATNVEVETVVKATGYKLARTTVNGVWNDPAHRFEFHGALSTDNIADFVRLLNR